MPKRNRHTANWLEPPAELKQTRIIEFYGGIDMELVAAHGSDALVPELVSGTF